MSNSISFVGTLGRDAELKRLPSGSSLLTMSVANNIGYGDNRVTIWFKVNIWGKRAESGLKDYLVKGQQVFISGDLTQNEYTKDGVTKTSLEVNANVVDLVGSKQLNDQELLDKKKEVLEDFDESIPF
jgi:single-strand DNA-binding protein